MLLPCITFVLIPFLIALNLRSTWVVAVIGSPAVKKTTFLSFAEFNIISPFSVSTLDKISTGLPIVFSIFFISVPVSFAV